MKKCIKSRKPPQVCPVLGRRSNLGRTAGPLRQNPPCLDFESETTCVSKAQGLANARPPGRAKFSNALPPGLTRHANAPQLPGGGMGAAGID